MFVYSALLKYSFSSNFFFEEKKKYFYQCKQRYIVEYLGTYYKLRPGFGCWVFKNIFQMKANLTFQYTVSLKNEEIYMTI